MSTSDGSLPAASAGPAVVASRLPPATRARPPVVPRRRNCARVVPWVCTGAPLWSAGRLGVATLDGGLVRAAGAFGSLRRGMLAPMQITRNSLDTSPGPADWFTGSVFVDTIASPAPPARTAAASVHFTPGARTAWHTHPFGQTIFVTEGIGRCQRRGGPVEEIRPGDRVFFEPGEDHWHGAAPDRFMVHIAIQEVDESGSPVSWGEHVSDEEYGAPPSR